jgi:ComF family protein
MPFLQERSLDDGGLCVDCRRGLGGFDAVYSFGWFEDQLRELIHLFKFGCVKPAAKPLGDMLARVLPRELKIDVIVPVPLHWTRLLTRGFNQSELLAMEVARRWQVPVDGALLRKKRTSSQTELTHDERRLNVEGAFEVRKSAAVAGRSVLLIDDVLTTGATARACARMLKRAGARRVTVLTLARTDHRPEAPSHGSPARETELQNTTPVQRFSDHAEP